MPRPRSLAVVAALVAAAFLLTACPAVHKRTRDIDRTPVVNTGAGATIIMPGGGGPAMPTGHPRYGGGVYGVPSGQAPAVPGYPGAAPAPQPRYGAAPYGGAPQGGAPYGGTPYGGAGTTTQHPHGGSAGGYGAAPPQAGAPGGQPYGQGGYGAPPPQSAPAYTAESGRRTSSGAPSGGGGHITMIGGSEIEETKHLEVDEEPAYFKYIAAPFVALAAPFKWAYDEVRGEPEPGPEVPRLETQPRPRAAPSGYDSGAPPPRTPGVASGHAAPPPRPRPQRAAPSNDYETAMLRNMEAELARRQASQQKPTTAARPGAPSATAGGSSFAAELAALQRRAGSAQTAERSARSGPEPGGGPIGSRPMRATTTGRAAPAPDGAADGIVDRDGDGRVDHWIYREDGRIARESFDDDFDGVPDRSLHYDTATDQVIRIEEDTDRDGGTDTWTSLRGGQVVRKRLDADGDGQVDTWTFFRDGVISRLERDSSGDGFRDRVAFYADGALEREEEDRDGDGSPDKITRFDAQARPMQVEEDKDRDGRIDMVSHYEGGRLKRRELLEASALQSGEIDGPEPRL